MTPWAFIATSTTLLKAASERSGTGERGQVGDDRQRGEREQPDDQSRAAAGAGD